MTKEDCGIEIIFVHVPKTAGTAMRKILLNIYGQDRIVLDYQKQPVEEILTKINGSPNFKVISGHFKVDKYQNLFPNAKRIVWLREPIKRLISQYNFWQRTVKGKGFMPITKEKQKLMAFAKVPINRNSMYRYIENINDFWFFGIQEFFAEDLNELRNKLGWSQQEIPHSNKHKSKHYKQLVKSVMEDSELKQRLINLNKKDVELYQRALSLREQRVNSVKTKTIELERARTLLKNYNERLQKVKYELEKISF